MNPNRPRFLFSTDRSPDLHKYKGETVTLPDGKMILIQTIVGNKFKPQFYEINGQHLIGMLRFHAQMIGDKSISEDQFKAFEAMEFEVRAPEKKSVLELHNKKDTHGDTQKDS